MHSISSVFQLNWSANDRILPFFVNMTSWPTGNFLFIFTALVAENVLNFVNIDFNN